MTMQYLRLARVQRFYGYVHLRPCISDFPRPDSPVRVMAGRDEVVVLYNSPQGERSEACFSLTRIRAWRLVTMKSDASTSSDHPSGPLGPVPLPNELQFEYLVATNNLRWVRLRCDSPDQTVLLSCVLQAMVDEAVSRKRGDRPSSMMRRAVSGDVKWVGFFNSRTRSTRSSTRGGHLVTELHMDQKVGQFEK